MSTAADALPLSRSDALTAPAPRSARRSELVVYLGAAGASIIATAWVLRLWRADLRVPFFYPGNDSTSVAAHFKTVLTTGWYQFNPPLGAPAGQQYHDFPTADNLHLMVARVLGWFTSDYAVAMNVYFLLGFPLAAVTAVYFLRVVGVSPALTVALATLYSVAPYHVLRGEGHLWLASYYPLPLALVVVWRVVRGEQIWGLRRIDADRLRRLPAALRPATATTLALLSGRGAATFVSLAVLGTASTYYAVFVVLLLAAAGLLAFARTRDRQRFAGAVAAGVTTVAAVGANMLPDVVYGWVHGPNYAALSRDGAASEIYAVKITSLLMPPPGHPIPAFNDFRLRYDESYPVPSESPSLGAVAAIGLLILLVMTVEMVANAVRHRVESAQVEQRRETLRSLAALTLTGLLCATVGGLSTIISFFTPNIRAWNRITIVLMLFCLAAVGLLIDGWLQRRARRAPTSSRWLPVAVAAVVLVVGVADQSLTRAVPPYDEAAAQFSSDSAFVQGIEAQVAPGSMIFQLPFVDFPESPVVNNVADADQVKLYLNSTTLRWSAGGIRGRPSSDWPIQVTSRDTPTMIRSLATIGFAGVTTDRKRLGDSAAALEAEVARETGPAQLISADGRYAFFSLAGPLNQVHRSSTTDQLAADAAELTNPVMAYPGTDFNAFDEIRADRPLRIYATQQRMSSMPVVNDRSEPTAVRLQLQVGSATGMPDVRITVGNDSVVVAVPPSAESAESADAAGGADSTGKQPTFVAMDATVTVPAGTTALTIGPGPATEAAESAAIADGTVLDVRYSFADLLLLDPLLAG